MALTDPQFIGWLNSSSGIRTVLVEAVANIGGSDTTLYLSSRNYTDGAANRTYTAVISGGLSTTEELNLDGTPSISYGDIEIQNESGVRDGWLEYIWSNRTANIYVGDPSWPRADFRLVFAGVVDDIVPRDSNKLALRLRDKLERLNVPLTESTLGGTTSNKARVIPLLFGDAFNCEPLLIDPVNLIYQMHNGAVQDLHEVRDGGTPITTFTSNLAAGKFTLTAAPVAQITFTGRGAKPSGTYANTVSALIQYIVTTYGPAATRLSGGDLDATQLAAFASACPQAVGLYASERENVIVLCQRLAASVGAQVVMTSTGLLRIVRLALPAAGTPTTITWADMDSDKQGQSLLQISQRPAVKASVKLGYARNYTPQTSGLLTGLPASSVAVLGQEWQSVTSIDSATATAYKLDAAPVLQETCLISQSEATTEAARRLALWKTQRAVYEATCLPHLLLTELGDAITIQHARYGLSAGKTGMVVRIKRDWLAGRATLGVLA